MIVTRPIRSNQRWKTGTISKANKTKCGINPSFQDSENGSIKNTKEIWTDARKKHIKAYLTVLSETNSQVRPVLCVLKSCFKHLKRLDVIDKDPTALFKLQQQQPMQRGEKSAKRTSQSNVCQMPAKKGKISFPLHILQIFVVLAHAAVWKCSDVVKSTMDDGDHYTIKIIKGKGGKSRTIPIKPEIGESLHQFAQQQAQKGSIWLFPSPQKANKPLTIAALSARIKTICESVWFASRVVVTGYRTFSRRFAEWVRFGHTKQNFGPQLTVSLVFFLDVCSWDLMNRI